MVKVNVTTSNGTQLPLLARVDLCGTTISVHSQV